MKRCFKCGESKPISSFYRHSKMADGHLNKCKECTKSDVKRHRLVNIDRIRAYDIARGSRQTPEYRKQYKADFPDRYKARTAVSNAVRDGRLTRQPCECCGASKVHGHHEDYSKPLSVNWLCPPCHKWWHQLKDSHA